MVNVVKITIVIGDEYQEGKFRVFFVDIERAIKLLAFFKAKDYHKASFYAEKDEHRYLRIEDELKTIVKAVDENERDYTVLMKHHYEDSMFYNEDEAAMVSPTEEWEDVIKHFYIDVYQ